MTSTKPKSARMPKNWRNAIEVVYHPNCSVPRYRVKIAIAAIATITDRIFPMIWMNVLWATFFARDIKFQ